MKKRTVQVYFMSLMLTTDNRKIKVRYARNADHIRLVVADIWQQR